MQKPSKEAINSCALNISPFIHRTPVLTSNSLNNIAGCLLYFKCENFQKVGAFKYRGATNAILNLTNEQKKRGVATHSSGNHAQALALAAKIAGIKAYIVMPSNSKKVKVEAVKGYGAEVVFCNPTLDSREETLHEVVKKTGAYFIHPYDNYEIITGQATAAYELIKDFPNLDYITAPVGGGGLLAGTALAAHYFSTHTKVVAAEPSGADDAYKSLKCGHIIPSQNPDTIADGLLTSLGERNFPIIKQLVSSIILISEREIVEAMQLIWERMKVIIEPSSAVAFAAVLKDKTAFSGKKVGIILSGGNVDLENLPFKSR